MAHGNQLGHIVPEARLGGPIAMVEDGDHIIIDSRKRQINWLVSDDEHARRREIWKASRHPQLTEKRGILFKYARDVAPANLGAYTD